MTDLITSLLELYKGWLIWWIDFWIAHPLVLLLVLPVLLAPALLKIFIMFRRHR